MKKVQSRLEAINCSVNNGKVFNGAASITFFVYYSHKIMFGRIKDRKSKSPYSVPTLNSGKSSGFLPGLKRKRFENISFSNLLELPRQGSNLKSSDPES